VLRLAHVGILLCTFSRAGLPDLRQQARGAQLTSTWLPA